MENSAIQKISENELENVIGGMTSANTIMGINEDVIFEGVRKDFAFLENTPMEH